MVPGGRSGVAGLLPTPPQSSNLLSQLSSPEAQLALASNLLSTLLRPQQPSPEVGIFLYMAVKNTLYVKEYNVNLYSVGDVCVVLHIEPTIYLYIMCLGTVITELGFTWSSWKFSGWRRVPAAFWLWSWQVSGPWSKQA
jgi:hypothetical protein